MRLQLARLKKNNNNPQTRRHTHAHWADFSDSVYSRLLQRFHCRRIKGRTWAVTLLFFFFFFGRGCNCFSDPSSNAMQWRSVVVYSWHKQTHNGQAHVSGEKFFFFFFSEDGVTAVCYWRLSFTCLHLCRSLMWVPVLPQHLLVSFTLNLNSLCKNSAEQIESWKKLISCISFNTCLVFSSSNLVK